MSAKPVFVGIAVLFSFLLHYAFYLLASFGKLNLKEEDISARNKKLYLLGYLGLLSIHFPSVWVTIFCWLSFGALVIIYISAIMNEERKAKFYNLGSFIYSIFLAVWWIGGTVDIFSLSA
jgi:hypothetical protein